jgi:hypothetical protein
MCSANDAPVVGKAQQIVVWGIGRETATMAGSYQWVRWERLCWRWGLCWLQRWLVVDEVVHRQLLWPYPLIEAT